MSVNVEDDAPETLKFPEVSNDIVVPFARIDNAAPDTDMATGSPEAAIETAPEGLIENVVPETVKTICPEAAPDEPAVYRNAPDASKFRTEPCLTPNQL